MIGHKQIIEARLSGQKPQTIFFEIGSLPVVKFPFEDPERALDYGLHAAVFLLPEELQTRLDLRFVVGCYACVSCRQIADDEIAFAEALGDCGAKAIAVCDGKEILHFTERKEWKAYANFNC